MIFDNIAVILFNTFAYSTPLILAALGGLFSERAGVINIGLEGMMTLGAFMAVAVTYFTSNPWLGALAGVLASMFLGLLHGLACNTFKANHIISGIAINFLGPGLALFISRLWFNGATQTKSLSLENKLPRPFNELFLQEGGLDGQKGLGLLLNQYISFYVALILVVIIWFIFAKTRLGLRLRSVGENPEAANSVGINVNRYRYIAVLTSAALAGLAGASMSTAVASQFRPTLVSGQGYIALAAMIFGKWRAFNVLGACLFFGGAQSIAIFLSKFDLGHYSSLLSIIPYAITLVVLAGVVGKVLPPKADGRNFDLNEL